MELTVFADIGDDDTAEDKFLFRLYRRIFLVRRAQNDPALVLLEIFQRPLAVHAGNDHIAVLRAQPLLDQDKIAGMDARVDHRIALDLE